MKEQGRLTNNTETNVFEEWSTNQQIPQSEQLQLEIDNLREKDILTGSKHNITVNTNKLTTKKRANDIISNIKVVVNLLLLAVTIGIVFYLNPSAKFQGIATLFFIVFIILQILMNLIVYKLSYNIIDKKTSIIGIFRRNIYE